MLNLQKKHLAAALECAGDRDVRPQLNGVALIVSASGRTYLAATDSHTAFVGKFTPDWVSALPAPFTLIIPRDTVKLAIKGKGSVRLSPAGERYTLGDSLFTPVEGRFPDLARVIPTAVSGETGRFDPDLLAQVARALRRWEGVKLRAYYLHHNGTGAGVMLAEDAVGIVMPYKPKLLAGADFKAFDLS